MTNLPLTYNSLHRPIRFGIDYTQAWTWNYSGVTDVNGKAQFTSGTNTYGTPPARFIYVSSGVYAGFHTIKSVDNSGNILTYTDYVSSTSGSLKILVNLKYRVYYGYPTQTSYFDVKPYWNQSGELDIDIATFLARVIPSPIVSPAGTFDNNMYTWFQIKILASPDFLEFLNANSINEDSEILSMTGYDWTVDTWYGINSSILSTDLNTNHVNAGQYLAPQSPIFFQGHPTIYSQIINNRVYNVII